MIIYIKDTTNITSSAVYKFTRLVGNRVGMFKFSSGNTFDYSKRFVSENFIKLKER